MKEIIPLLVSGAELLHAILDGGLSEGVASRLHVLRHLLVVDGDVVLLDDSPHQGAIGLSY